ncbi:SDR family oxidoreductase [Leeia sp. TBRC 13508]|uniref:SDR family oxidoreductase n=1 Tax=Leeia speluncae TaxID=2884804 RepID=A0ABS8D8P6_9NEIS|nr:SDR family oxidoreductase [Leeia speluncae]MCB6184555.1 SDR family oxidoreductase [Leeia speluncae]
MMKVFLTGATGFIGSHLIPVLQTQGHQVIGVARTDAGLQTLQQQGVEPHFGLLEDISSLQAGAVKADAIIHTAFDHHFATMADNCKKDHGVILGLGDIARDKNIPLIITSGVGIGEVGHGQPAQEDVFNKAHANPRIASELAAEILEQQGIDVRVVRLPQVHNQVKHGLITYFIAISQQKGAVAYVNDGTNEFSAGHVSDVANLYSLVLSKGEKGKRYHAVGEIGISSKAIAEAVGELLQLPVVSISEKEAPDFFGWYAMFASLNLRASSDWTQSQLGWHPTGPSLLSDLRHATLL